MFTGIITDVGILRDIIKKPHVETFIIETNFEFEPINLGASIACNGCCLTVTKKEKSSNNKTLLWFDLSPESLNKTTYRNAKTGDLINLEKSLKIGDELGGHLVTGHIDTKAKITKIIKDNDNWIMQFRLNEPEFQKFISNKGSITINGTSLTINKIENDIFEINIIPHTLANTNFHFLNENDEVNIEVDTISRYLSKLIKPEFLR
ncbi:MAG: riboflavin synthase [Rickettsiales bacterium]|nr:riboflavin synthase [Rickettsiales bacterium]